MQRCISITEWIMEQPMVVTVGRWSFNTSGLCLEDRFHCTLEPLLFGPIVPLVLFVLCFFF